MLKQESFLLKPVYLWKGETEENGEAEDEEIPGRAQVNILESRDSHGGNHGKLNVEDASNNRPRDGDEGCAHLGYHPTYQHNDATVLNHPSAAHLQQQNTSIICLLCTGTIHYKILVAFLINVKKYLVIIWRRQNISFL